MTDVVRGRMQKAEQRAEAAEAERDRLAGRVAELEREKAKWQRQELWLAQRTAYCETRTTELEMARNELKSRFQQATEALRGLGTEAKACRTHISAKWLERQASQALAALAGEDDA